MKVILNQDVHNLGEEGDVCDVKRGYARNYLIPKQLAFPHVKQYVAMFENRKEAITKRKEEKRLEANSLKEKVESLKLVVAMPAGDTGKLFGSVSNLTIAEELNKAGFSIERKKIELAHHALKMIGTHTAKIKLYAGEYAALKFEIVKSDDTDAAPAEAKKADPVVVEEAEAVEAEAEAVEAEAVEAEAEAVEAEAVEAEAEAVEDPAETAGAVEEPAEAVVEEEAAAAAVTEEEVVEEEEAAAVTEEEVVEEEAVVEETAAAEASEEADTAAAE